MDLDLIRAIDKWVGIPACFLLSLGHKVHLYFKGGSQLEHAEDRIPEKILFIELSEMGSAILAYSAMRYVLAKYPKARLYFLIFEQNRFSVDVLGIIPAAHVLAIDVRSPLRFVVTTFKAVRAIRKAGIDTVFDLELFSRFSALLSGITRASARVGYGRYHEEGLYRGGFMTHRVFYNAHQHMAKNFLALVKAVEQECEPPLTKEVVMDHDLVRARYRSSDHDLDALRKRLDTLNPVIREAEHVILFNPSAGELLPVRAWPAENYGTLAKKILEQFNAVVIVIGLDKAGREAGKILDAAGADRCIDFTGKSSLKDLMDLLTLADVLVTADCGPAHFASLTPVKSIVLFGPETPLLYGPLGPNTLCLSAGMACSPCLSAYNHRKTGCTDPKCMKAITVDEVFDKVCSWLTGLGSGD